MPGTMRSFSIPTIAKVKNSQSTACAAMNSVPSRGDSSVMARAAKAAAKCPMYKLRQPNFVAAQVAALAATAVAKAPQQMSTMVIVVDHWRSVAWLVRS